MKKSTKITLMVSICLISVGIVFSTIGFFAGASPSHILFNGLWNYQFHYDNDYENNYDKNNTYRVSDQTIDSLEIDWISGNVTVIPYEGRDIIIKESSRGSLNDENCLRYRIDGSTLQIDYMKGTGQFNFSGNFDESKSLTVKVPKQMLHNMEELNFDSVSADLKVKDVMTESFNVDTTSGDLTAMNVKADYVEMQTVSGDIKAIFLRCPKEFNFDSTSGNCDITLPKDSSVAVSFDSVSGDFSTDFALKMSGDDEYIIGEGKYEFNMGTVSGGVDIYKAAK